MGQNFLTKLMELISLGLLDLGYRDTNNSLTIIQEVMDYAISADSLYFKRFWLAEHHNPNRMAPFTNPETIITLIAGVTNEIRVGSAGTLIKIHPSYDTVTTFKLLNNIFGNRIDLGFSKGEPGSQSLRNQIKNLNEDIFNLKVKEICSLFYQEERNFIEKEIVIPPYLGQIPELWYLSNSYQKFSDVIKYKLNFCRSLIHGPGLLNKNYQKEELIKNRELYFDLHNCFPQISIAVGLVIDDSFEKAKKKHDKLVNGRTAQNSSTLEVLPVTIPILYELINEYSFLYGVYEFILYDIEGNNEKKLENIQMISESFKLGKSQVYEDKR